MNQHRRVIHPCLIACFPILLLYSRNLSVIDFRETLLPMALACLAALLAWLGLRALRFDGPAAALVVSAGLLLFFSFGHAARLAGRLGMGLSLFQTECLMLASESLAMVAVVGVVYARPGVVRPLTSLLNASSIALVALSLSGILRQTWTGPEVKQPVAEARPVPELSPPKGRLPDVYLIVLDAYGRSDSLREMTGFDNSAFLDRLEQKGFSVARRSTANYCQTALSLSATLNFRYLDDLAGSASDDRLPLKRLISDAAVFRAFRRMGYRVLAFDSGFDATESIASDVTLGSGWKLGTFGTMLVDQTPLWLMLGCRARYQPHQMHRKRVLRVFDELPATSHPAEAPTFTFAHVLSPHPPFIFGADGRDVSEREGGYSLGDSEGWRDVNGHGDASAYAERYGAQAAYVTRRIEEAVTRILETSPVEPIIIIQGDHGAGSHFEAGADRPNDLGERMTVLNAIYLPRAYRTEIEPTITPVNTFRLVLDRCFGAGLGLLDDRNYYSAYQRPYIFTEVTGTIDRPVGDHPAGSLTTHP